MTPPKVTTMATKTTCPTCNTSRKPNRWKTLKTCSNTECPMIGAGVVRGDNIVKMPSRKPVVTEEVLTYNDVKADRINRTTIIENPVIEDSGYMCWE